MRFCNVVLDDDGPTAPLPEGVTWDPDTRTVTLDSAENGDLIIDGDGEGSAVRDGDGHGFAIRRGDGEGSAYRDGGGGGDACRKGTGEWFDTRAMAIARSQSPDEGLYAFVQRTNPRT